VTTGTDFKTIEPYHNFINVNLFYMLRSILTICFVLFSYLTYAQDNPRPTKSRFWKSKESTFKAKTGDILVYKVTNNEDKYDFIVRVKKFGSSINFDYDMPQKHHKANVNIQAGAVTDATRYQNYFSGKNLELSNESTVWLSKRNYQDLVADGETTMDFGDGAETFVRGNNGVLKINVKGKEKIITVFHVNNTSGNKKHLLVLTDAANPLIVRMDLGWNLVLKEVR